MGKKCIIDLCNTFASYNYKNEKKAIYCLKHKKENMIDVKNQKRKCLENNCNKIATFNFKEERNAIYCTNHKKENMIDILNKKCLVNNCNKRPCFNFEIEIKGIYCKTHKMSDMINVTDRTCQEANCKIQPTYNYENETKRLYCALHKKEGMINVANKLCINDGCNKQAIYNFKNIKYGVYCYTHKKDEMINVLSSKCKSSWCETTANPKYDGFCLNCFINLFPDKPNTLNYKTKEKAVVDYVFQQFPKDKFTWFSDKRIEGGCSRRRPDLLLDLGYQVIIIEVDENQHTDYDCSCENKRLMELSQDVGHRPIIFIRFNPDEYIDKDNTNITSCWGINGKGICTVKKIKNKEWEYRLKLLKENIKYWCNNNTNKTIEIIQLFYNQNS
jgi:hypothetical protein